MGLCVTVRLYGHFVLLCLVELVTKICTPLSVIACVYAYLQDRNGMLLHVSDRSNIKNDDYLSCCPMAGGLSNCHEVKIVN
jgi:hypothetical protein